MEIQFHIDNDITRAVKKQLSRGRYTITDGICKLEIICNDKRYSISLDDNCNVLRLRDYCVITKESSVVLLDKFLDNYIYNHGKNCSLIYALKEYQDTNLRYGNQIKNKIFYKLYSNDKRHLNLVYRSMYGAKWIDYSDQISNRDRIIFDENQINGLWAMKDDQLKNIVYSIEMYGDRMFTLELLPDCRYLLTDKEIIGDRFKVIRSNKLSRIVWIRKIQLLVIILRNFLI